MTGATLTDSHRAIKSGDIHPVYYLTGAEDLLKDEFVDFIVEQVVDPGTRDFNLDIRNAGDLDGESLIALVETPPMLADRRVAVVRNLEQWRKNSKPWKMLYQYLANPSDMTALVLIHGAGHPPDSKVTARSTHIEVEVGDGAALRGWALRRAERAGICFEEDALTHLVEASGRSLSRMASEIEKLAAATSETDPLSVETVGQFIGVHRGETQADWIEAVLTRDATRAVNLLDGLLEQSGVTAVRLLMALGSALVGVRLARAHLDTGRAPGAVRGALLSAMKASRPFGIGRYGDEADRWVAAAGRWPAPDLDRAIGEVYTADQRLKASTLSDDRGTLRSMLLTFGTLGNP